MARIEGVTDKEAGLIAKVAFWFTKRKVGRVITPIRIHAHHTRILRGYGGMEMGQEAAKSIDPLLKCLIHIRAAMRIGCPF